MNRQAVDLKVPRVVVREHGAAADGGTAGCGLWVKVKEDQKLDGGNHEEAEDA